MMTELEKQEMIDYDLKALRDKLSYMENLANKPHNAKGLFVDVIRNYFNIAKLSVAQTRLTLETFEKKMRSKPPEWFEGSEKDQYYQNIETTNAQFDMVTATLKTYLEMASNGVFA